MNQTVESILDTFQTYRMQPTPLDQYDQVGKPLLRDRVSTFVSVGKPIDFVMLGFPFKSTNIRDKVIGILPDAAEEATIKNFERFANNMKRIYPQGVNVHIVSDGYIFNDMLGVSDNVVAAYKEVSVDMAKNAPITFYDINDFYSHGSLADKRGKAVADFGISEEKLQNDILFNPDVNFLYRGMIRFMEEELAMNTYPSKNQLQKAAKKLTREMMFRNEAYSNLVRNEFSSMVRLSMHPSINNGAKYSFQLIPSPKAKHSAWHSALLLDGDGNIIETIHRKDAEQQGCSLVMKDGRPYYFTTEKH